MKNVNNYQLEYASENMVDLLEGQKMFYEAIVIQKRLLAKYPKYQNSTDSFDHEVWHFHPQKKSRLVLIIDMWHPNLSECDFANVDAQSAYDIITSRFPL